MLSITEELIRDKRTQIENREKNLAKREILFQQECLLEAIARGEQEDSRRRRYY